MKISLAISLMFVASTAAEFTNSGPPFNNCNSSDYYASLKAAKPLVADWTVEEVVDLITVSHRNVLKSVAPVENGDDIILALKDLWHTESPDNIDRIRVIYRDIAFPSNRANTQLGWERADLWPKNLGWSIPDDKEPWTDIYGKAPADATVLVRKANKFFGECGTVENDDKCSRPATTETAPTSEQDGKIFAPPDNYKGDVARSLFYFAARYKESHGLTLVDCPPFANNEFGYLSQLLEWHVQDPVSDEERARNDLGCSRWQGNRNVFVDYPELVDTFYPDGPDTLVLDSYKYSMCLGATEAPTADPNSCSDLMPGDLPIFLMNSDDPDQVVGFPLVDIPESVGALYMTDNYWDGTQMGNTEGTYMFEIPAGGLRAGQIFGFGDNSPMAELWEQLPEGGNRFDLQNTGDNIFIYCINADLIPNFITGFSFNGPWLAPGLTPEEYGTGYSALPPGLEKGGSLFLDHFDNCVYVGPLRNVDKADLAMHMIDPQFFDCINDPRIQLDLTSSGTRTMTAISTLLVSLAVYCLVW